MIHKARGLRAYWAGRSVTLRKQRERCGPGWAVAWHESRDEGVERGKGAMGLTMASTDDNRMASDGLCTPTGDAMTARAVGPYRPSSVQKRAPEASA